jgi:hypothetical protein
MLHRVPQPVLTNKATTTTEYLLILFMFVLLVMGFDHLVTDKDKTSEESLNKNPLGSPPPKATWAATQAPVAPSSSRFPPCRLRSRARPKDAGPKDNGGGASLLMASSLRGDGAKGSSRPRRQQRRGGGAPPPRPNPASLGLDPRLASLGTPRTAPTARNNADEGGCRSCVPLPGSASPTGGSTTGGGRGTRSDGGDFRRQRPSCRLGSQRRTSDGDLDAGRRLAAAPRIPWRARRCHGGVAWPPVWHHSGAAVTCPVVRCVASWRRLLLLRLR